MNAQEANHEAAVTQALALGLDLNGESTEEIQAMIARAECTPGLDLEAIDAQLNTRTPRPAYLARADTQLGIAESALRKAYNALRRHGEREGVAAELKKIRASLRTLNPMKRDL